jgi:hypothetical protein
MNDQAAAAALNEHRYSVEKMIARLRRFSILLSSFLDEGNILLGYLSRDLEILPRCFIVDAATWGERYTTDLQELIEMVELIRSDMIEFGTGGIDLIDTIIKGARDGNNQP